MEYWRLKLLDVLRGTCQRELYTMNIQHMNECQAADIRSYWDKKCKELVDFHIRHNSGYRDFLLSQNININNWDFHKLPIITKKELSEKMVVSSEVFKWSHTGGSSGNPFSYPLSRKAASALWPNLWRAFYVCDVKPCDPVMMIAGPSLFNNRSIKRKIFDYINRFTVVSAFDLNEENLKNAVLKIKQKNIKAIYGYTSSVLVFLEFLRSHNIHLSLKGIFTTSETFIPKVRKLAKEYCACDVIDIYGANDGGICAFECRQHNGYHISFERTCLEVIDNKIILTDLYNTAYPFIRYEVGDMTTSDNVRFNLCQCGCQFPMIEEIAGRINSYITDIDGTKIHTEFFSHIFHDDHRIEQYQILEKKSNICVNIHCAAIYKEDLTEKYFDLIQKRFKKKCSIIFNEAFVRLKNQKTPILVKE